MVLNILQVLHLSHVKPKYLKTTVDGDSKKAGTAKQPHRIPLRACNAGAEARKYIHDLAATINSVYDSVNAAGASQSAHGAQGAAFGNGGASTSTHAGAAAQNGAAPSPSAPPLPGYPAQTPNRPGVLPLLLRRVCELRRVLDERVVPDAAESCYVVPAVVPQSYKYHLV